MSRADELTDALPAIALRLTEWSSERHVLDAAVEGLVNDFGAALARVWLGGPPGRTRFRSMRLADGRALRLVAQYHHRVNLENEGRRQVMAAPWIKRIADEHVTITTSRLYHGGATPDAGWMRMNRFRAFAGFPLGDRDRLRGVLALFTRFPLTERAAGLLSVFAGQLAAALRLHAELAPSQTAEGMIVPAGSTLDQAMRLYIEHALQEVGGKIEGPGGAAEMLGIHPNTLRSRMEKLGVERA